MNWRPTNSRASCLRGSARPWPRQLRLLRASCPNRRPRPIPATRTASRRSFMAGRTPRPWLALNLPRRGTIAGLRPCGRAASIPTAKAMALPISRWSRGSSSTMIPVTTTSPEAGASTPTMAIAVRSAARHCPPPPTMRGLSRPIQPVSMSTTTATCSCGSPRESCTKWASWWHFSPVRRAESWRVQLPTGTLTRLSRRTGRRGGAPM